MEIERLVRERAFTIANVKDLIIKFSNQMNRSYALCYWQETPQEIHFNKKFIDLNKNNYVVLNELIVHECIHLIPGYNRHNKKFFDMCKKFNIDAYGFSVDYNYVNPIFTSSCTKCHNYKKYYAKPKKTKCHLCNGTLKIVNHSDEYDD